MTPATRVPTCLFEESFPAEEVSVGVARQGVWNVLRAAGYCDDLAGDAGTIVTELASNAVRAAVEEPIRVRLSTVHGGGVWVEVWDDQDAEPAPRPAVQSLDDLDELSCDELIGGWGLGIVASLSAAQGVRTTEPHGKWVGALVATRPDGTTPR
ncbi:ATP-binding protein [Spirillospora sp. NPDC049652]